MDGLDPFDPNSGWFGSNATDAGAPASDKHGNAAFQSVLTDTWDDKPEAVSPALALEQALVMASRGYRIFPLVPGGKEPFKGLAWKVNATTETDNVRAWFSAQPDANYAIAAGDGLLILDVDGAAGEASLAALLKEHGTLPETLTVRTPGGGRHIYLSGPDVLNSASRIGAGLDIRSAGGYVVGPGSVFADPGGKKGYTGPYQIISDAPTAEAPAWLLLIAGTPAERGPRKPPACEPDLPENLEWAARGYLALEPEHGGAPVAIQGKGGNTTTYQVFARLRDLGISAEKSVELAEEHWNARCQPSWSHHELVALAANAEAYGQNAFGACAISVLAESFNASDVIEASAEASAPAATAGSSPLIRRRIRAGEPRPPVRWRVKEVLPATGVGMIFGPPSAGKSTLALDLAAHLSRGADWFGRRTRERTGTLILACEGAGSLGTRLDALGTDGGPQAIEAWDIGSLSTAGLASLRPELEQLDASWRQQHGFGVGLVVLDTISASGMVDDENANAKVAAALKALADFAGSVGAFGLAVHHPRKDGETFRGAGAFEGNTDLIFEVRRGTSSGTGELSIYKARDSATGALGRFRLRQVTLGQDDEGEPVTACVVEPKANVFDGEPVADPEAVLTDLIRRGPDGDGPHTADRPGGCFRMDEGRSRDSIYRAIAEAFGIPFGTKTGMLKLDHSDRKAVKDHLRRLNPRLACTDDGRDRERRQVRVVLALHPRAATVSDFGDAMSV